ncbi:MAG: glycolate oxidase subunit GlcE [Burkholderiaceae bacterium]|nr:glycolate oxidase subunit GlcE [Burkholderiaceae bacterium]MDO9089447.1 glycolate oxidase subunit GlcE [Burkholderiaceae bacterium]
MDPTVQGFSQRIREAAAAGGALRIRGGGSKDFYGERLEGELLDTRGHAGIISYEPSELVVTARCGTPLADLEVLLAANGQCLPFEPPHWDGSATVGGMVAAGLSGPARASAGSVRDHVLGVTLLDGRGELLVFGGQVMKNVAGYDVSRLMAGALGTLGLLVEISLKVLPVAVAEATLRFELKQAQALQKLHEWGGQPLPLNASCWVEDDGLPCLYLRLRGAQAAVESACVRLGGERQDTARSAADWRLSRDLRLPLISQRGSRDLWRLSVPQTAPVLDLPAAPVVEWHGAQRWVLAEARDGARVRAAAAQVGGHATLFMPGEPTAAAYLPRFDSLTPTLARIHLALKQQFDPAGVFNRGRLSAAF